MKNLFLQIIAILCLSIVACKPQSSKTEISKSTSETFLPLKDRNPELAKLNDWMMVKSKASELHAKIEADSTDFKSKLLLAQLYMQEARVTGEHPYYYPATLAILNNIIRHENTNFEALAFKSSVLLSLHHFQEALQTGKMAEAINPNNGFIYGILCDANVELGNYEEAVKMSDKMQGIRPGLESYSRASYLREIYGDNAGAIQAMKLAFQAGLPGSEEASWAGNTLAHLLENNNDLEHAEELSLIILQQRGSYAFAIDALGRIEMAKGNFDKAIVHFEDAIKIMPEFSFYENMSKAYKYKGDSAKAKAIMNDVLGMLNEDAVSGHYADLELAYVYLDLGNTEKALEHASIEYKRRPMNIDVNACMAWVSYTRGDFNEAKTYMDKAMRMGTQNAQMLAKASIIARANGDLKAAQAYLNASRKIKKSLPLELENEIKLKS